MDIFEAIARDVFRTASVLAAPSVRVPRATGASRADRVFPVDSVEISDEALALSEADEIAKARAIESGPAKSTHRSDESPDSEVSEDTETSVDPTSKLNKEEKEEVKELKERDQEVRTHEQAHMAAAGPYARGGPTFEYERGPDNRRYAVGGEVHIDTSKEGSDPEANIRKAQVIRRAALAPGEPSVQDRLVASRASRMEAEARQELAEQHHKVTQGEGTDSETESVSAATEKESAGKTDAEGRRSDKEAGQWQNRFVARYLSSVVSSIMNPERSDQIGSVDMFA